MGNNGAFWLACGGLVSLTLFALGGLAGAVWLAHDHGDVPPWLTGSIQGAIVGLVSACIGLVNRVNGNDGAHKSP